MIKSIFSYFLRPVSHYSNFFILNFFGFQVFRHFVFRSYLKTIKFFMHLKNITKRRYLKTKYTKILEELESNGCVKVHNLFSNEEFIKLTNLVESINKDLSIYEEVQNKNKVSCFKFFNINFSNKDESGNIKKISEIIYKNKTLNELYFLLNYYQITDSMLSYQKIEPINLDQQEHINSIMHNDRFYEFFKFFISINKVTKNNAAFKYSKKSHRYSLKKHLFEYIGSILESINNISKNHLPILKYNRFYPSKFLNLDITDMETEPNTLIIENGAGFHAAGKFNDINLDRKYIRINPLEESDIYFLPFFLKLKKQLLKFKK